MGIKNIKERLEGSYRLIRIKRIKMGFYAIELILGLVLGFAMAAFLGMKFEPFYFPLDTFAFIMLIMLLIISAENIYFNGLELRYTKNKSRKYLLARNAIRGSIAVIAVAGVCVLILMLPYSQERISEMHAVNGSGTVGANQEYTNASFQCQDQLGFTRGSTFYIEVNNTENQVRLILGGLGGTPIWEPSSTPTYPLWSGLEDSSNIQNSVYVVVENQASEPIHFNYSVASEVSPIIKTYIPILGMAFIVVQFAAISIMYPIRETYASASIYSKKYVPEKDSGEYSISEIKLSKKEKDEDEALLDKALDMELVPPKPARPVPKVQEQKEEPAEMARAKGRVDDGLIEEPDVECANCGEMNSAHSAMCFSCGTALKAREKVAVDPAAYLKKGESFANAGRYDDAIGCYDEALKHDGMNEVTLLRKGEALHKLGRWGNAIQYVNTALKVNPNNVQTLVLKAKILEERDRMDKSIEIYTQILALDPENAFAKSRMERLGRKFEQVAEEAEVESAEDVLEQFMDVPGIGLARATALYEAGYTSMEMLKKASEDQLMQVKGISKGVAKKIRKALDGI